MIFAFFSRRLRQWVLLALILPLAGRLLEAVGVRVGGRNPRAGRALRGTAGYLRPQGQGRRRRRR